MSTSALHEIENKALTLTESERATLFLHGGFLFDV